jgi:hypothetical protein
MELNEIESILDSALKELLENDSDLFRLNVFEPTISSQLKLYLRPHFPTYDVDCEYDKYGNADKTDQHGNEVRPDVNVHKRGILKKYNLIAIELKKGKYPDLGDKRKLEYFTDSHGKYKYKFGFFIGFTKQERKRVPVKRLYQHGILIYSKVGFDS